MLLEGGSAGPIARGESLQPCSRSPWHHVTLLLAVVTPWARLTFCSGADFQGEKKGNSNQFDAIKLLSWKISCALGIGRLVFPFLLLPSQLGTQGPPESSWAWGAAHSGSRSQQGPVPGGLVAVAQDLPSAIGLRQVCSPGNPGPQPTLGPEGQSTQVPSPHPVPLPLSVSLAGHWGGLEREIEHNTYKWKTNQPWVSRPGRGQMCQFRDTLSLDAAKWRSRLALPHLPGGICCHESPRGAVGMLPGFRGEGYNLASSSVCSLELQRLSLPWKSLWVASPLPLGMIVAAAAPRANLATCQVNSKKGAEENWFHPKGLRVERVGLKSPLDLRVECSTDKENELGSCGNHPLTAIWV